MVVTSSDFGVKPTSVTYESCVLGQVISLQRSFFVSNLGQSYCLSQRTVVRLTKGIKHVKCLAGVQGGKEYVCQAGDLGSIHGSERSPGEGNGNPF